MLFSIAQGVCAQVIMTQTPFLVCVGDTATYTIDYVGGNSAVRIDSVRWRFSLGEWDIDIREIDTTVTALPFYFVYTDTFFNPPLTWNWPSWYVDVYLSTPDGSSGSAFLDGSIGGVPECEIRRVGFTSDRRRICAGECVDFTDTSDRHPRHQRWYFEGADTPYSEERHPRNVCYDTPGLYAVRHAVANTVNSDSISIDGYIEVLPRPTLADSVWVESWGYGGDTVALAACADVAHYKWSPPDGLSCTDCPAPALVLGAQTEYTLEAWDDEDCVQVCGYRFEVRERQRRVYVPSAFSPNGDGNNDLFMAYGTSFGTRQLEVYDRWGSMLFEGTGADAAWDGRAGGQDAPSVACMSFVWSMLTRPICRSRC